MGQVHNVYQEGGKYPMPKEQADPGSEKPKSEGFREVSEAILEAEKVRAFKDALAGGEKPIPKAEEKTTVDISEIVKSQTSLTQTLITQLTDMLKTKPEDLFVKHLTEEIATVRQRLEGSGQIDPVAALTSNMETLKRLTDIMKEHLGISNVQPQVSDLPRMLELEQLRIDAAERQRQHDERMEELRHQHKIETLKWQADYNLRLMEFKESKQAKERATATLEDLVGSLSDSIKVERTGASGGAEEAAVRIPKAYKCEVCGNVIEVPKDQDLNAPIVCESCGAVYGLEEVK